MKALTVDNCSSLCATICHCSPLFETIRTTRYSTIRYSGFPDTHLQSILSIMLISTPLYIKASNNNNDNVKISLNDWKMILH